MGAGLLSFSSLGKNVSRRFYSNGKDIDSEGQPMLFPST